jgi:hypothetical protein
VVEAHCDRRAFERRSTEEDWTGQAVGCPQKAFVPCESIACSLDRAVCIGHTYAELGNAIGEVLLGSRLPGATGYEVTVPPQDLAARALLLEMGLQRFFAAGQEVPTAFPTDGTLLSSPELQGDCNADFTYEVSNITAISFLVGDYAMLIDELAYGAMDAYTRLADSSAGQLADPVEAARTRWELRRYAGELVVGNHSEGASEYSANPFCDRASRTPATQAAVDAIRASAVDPARLMATPDETESPISLNDFLYSGPHSVLTRYYLATSRLEFFPSPGVVNLPSPSEFLEDVGVTDGDFAAAREVIRQEIIAFRRPLTAVIHGDVDQLPLPPTDMAGNGYQIDPSIYVATREEPTLPSWLLYANGNGTSNPGELYTSPTIGSHRYLAANIANQLTAAVGDDYGPRFEELLTATNAAHSMAITDYRGGVASTNVEIDWSEVIPDPGALPPGAVFNYAPEGAVLNAMMFLFGEEHEEFRVTSSVEDLHCATRGSNESGMCSADTMELMRPMYSVPQALGGDTFPAAGRIYYFEQPEGAERLFFLQPRPGAAPDAPGGYVEYAAVDVPEDFEESPCAQNDGGSPDAGVPPPECTEQYDIRLMQPEAERRAAQLLMPSATDCTSPNTDCAGTLFGERLPLEDSITDDGDAFESSWRSYLVRARQAADRADELGRQAQGTQLEVELRAEAAIAEIQAICGSAISIEPLTRLDVIARDCPDADSPLEIVTCLGATNPGMDDLMRCLETSTVRPFVSLGSQELCIYYPPGQPSQVCRLASGAPVPAEDCPRQPHADDDELSEQEDTPSCVAPDDHESARIHGRDLLGLFSAPQLTQDTKAPPGFCDDVREARRLLTAGQARPRRRAWEKIFQESEFFSPSNIRRVGRGVRWVARPGSFSSVMVGERTVFSNGDITNGPRTTGTCDAPSGFDETRCATGRIAGSLFCSATDCSDANARALQNGRMLYATVVARWLAQQTLEGFVLPWNPPDNGDHGPDSYEGRSAVGIEDSWSGERGTYGRFSVSRSNLTAVGTCTPFGAYRPDQYMWIFARPGHTTISADAPCPWGGVSFADVTSDSPYGPSGAEDFPELNLFAVRQDQSHLIAGAFLASMREFTRPRFNSFIGMNGDISVTDSTGPWDAFPWIVLGGAVSDATAVLRASTEYYTRGQETSLGASTLFDAFELLCEVDATPRSSVVDPSRTNITADDLPDVLNDLKYSADAIHGLANRMVFTEMPDAVIESLDARSSTGSSGIHGEYGIVVAGLRSAMVDLSAVPEQMAAEVRRLERAIRSANQELDRLSNIDVIDRNNYKTSVAEQTNQCVQSVFDAAQSTVFAVKAIVVGTARAAAQCATNATNIQRLTRNLAANEAIGDSSRALLILTAENVSDEATVNLRLLETRLRTSSAAIDQYLIQLRSMRTRADRALARALFQSTDASAAMIPVSRSLRTRHSAEQERYRRAERDAIRLSFLAKRAIEQRFGVRLADLTSDLSLVSRPASWESTICEMDGIDFGQQTSEDPNENSAGQYTAGAVGDYVSLLESFVESYRHDFPFTDGSDLAVLSLRDDVQNTRALCEAPVGNLLYFAASLTEATVAQPVGWRPTGCFLESAPEGEAACISVAPADGIDGPPSGSTGVANPMRLTFQPGHPDCPGVECPCVDENGLEDASCGWRPGATYSQALAVSEGLYRLSWYELSEAAAYRMPELSVRSASSSPAAQVQDIGSYSAAADEVWTRRWRYVFVPTVQTIEVHVGPQLEYGEAGNELMEPVVAGVMLERMPGVSPSDERLAYLALPPFAATGDSLDAMQLVCEDTTGENFREESWTYSCEELCDLGFSGSCPESERTRYCFWETSFSLSEESIQRSASLAASGFARGNFNYRADTVAVNFVGTASRQCQDASLPSTCHSAGFIPYSLEHFGPYTVYGHDGREYESSLFTGRIEHARGLAAERYISNPISGADQALIGQYTQSQFRGRPLTGTYRLRVWDEPGVNFRGIEDVQVVLGYRYWTRTN